MSKEANIYLGRQEFLFSINEMYEVANELTIAATGTGVPKDRFMQRVASSISRIANTEGGSPINYVYHEQSNTHFTNFKGLLITFSYCPPNIRLKFIESLKKLVAIETPTLDMERRNIAVKQIQAGDDFLVTEEVAQKCLHDPEATDELLANYTRSRHDEETKGSAEQALGETDDPGSGKLLEESSI